MAAPTPNQFQAMREQLDRCARVLLLAENNSTKLSLPEVQAVVKATVSALAAYSGYSEPTTGTSAILNSGVLFTSPLVSGVRVTGYVPTIVNGAVTALVGG